MSQPTKPISPIEQLKADLSSTQRDVNDLQNKVNLSSIYDTLEDIQVKVKGLKKRVNDLRQHNYVFETSLEKDAQDLEVRWQSIYANVKVKISQEISQLKIGLRPIEGQLVRASSNLNNVAVSRQILNPLKVSVENLSKKVDASESLIRGMYDSFESQLNTFNRTLLNIEWTVKELETSSGKLLAHEYVIIGVKAVWTKDGKENKDDPEGVLFLTDQRILFEQKEEVATKKFLFITKERELIQDLLVDIPINYVESVQASKQGIFKNQDFLEINYLSGAQYSTTEFHIHNQNCEDWKGLINKVIAGDFIKDRTEQIDQEVLNKIKNAPTICPHCGGTLTAPILRGMEQFSCEFCGAVIKL